jgi:hypothetical protein
MIGTPFHEEKGELVGMGVAVGNGVGRIRAGGLAVGIAHLAVKQ